MHVSLSEPHRCRQCIASFKRLFALTQHEIFAHQRLPTPKNELELKERCELCDNMYSTRNILRKHMRKKHGEVSKQTIITTSEYLKCFSIGSTDQKKTQGGSQTKGE